MKMTAAPPNLSVYVSFFAVILVAPILIHFSVSNTLVQNLELLAYDRMLNIRSTPLSNSPVTLITITDNDLTKLQQSSIPDGKLSDVLSKLLVYRPRAIGVDLYRDIPIPPGTGKLKSILNSNKEIIIAKKYGDAASGGIDPPPYLSNHTQAGCTDFPLDSDNRVRRALIYLGDGEYCFSLGYLLAMRYLAHEGIEARSDPERPDILNLRENELPRIRSNDGGYRGTDDNGYQLLFDFRFSVANFRRYSIHDALNDQIDPSDIYEKILLIGTDAESNKDFFAIPDLSRNGYSRKTAGVMLHALFTDQLIRSALYGDRQLKVFSEWQENLWSLLWVIAGIGIGVRSYSLGTFFIFQILGFFLIFSVASVLFYIGFWLPLLPAAIGWFASTTFSAAWSAHREYGMRNFTMNLFARHVSEPVAKEVWEHRATILNGGKLVPQRLVATIFFSDLANFTQIAENMDPEAFIDWLNEYIDAMVTVIHEHNGVVIRFIGDAIMAGFGIPISRTKTDEIAADAICAVSCSLAIRDALTRLNKNWASRNLPAIAMRIGLNTGPLLAGSLGNKNRLEYTIHGDTVNTAARLESHDKESFSPDYFNDPCRILISSATHAYLDSRFCSTYLGNIKLKGKSQGIDIFRLI